MNLVFEGVQSCQDMSLGVFMSLLIILGVEIFVVTSPKLETLVVSKYERIQFIWIINSMIIILEVCSQF